MTTRPFVTARAAADLLGVPEAADLRDIPGHEGRYAVTRDGRVWSYPKKYIAGTGGTYGHAGRWLKPAVSNGRYLTVVLSGRSFYVHRAVALAWVENPMNLPHVNHINGKHADARAENLEWCTPRENNLHARATGANPARTPARIEHCRRMREIQREKRRDRLTMHRARLQGATGRESESHG